MIDVLAAESFLALRQQPMAAKFQYLGVLSVVAAFWIREVGSRTQPGLARLAFATPFVLANLFSIFLFDNEAELIARVLVAFTLGWHSAFKLLAFCLGRGPLTLSWTFPQLVALYLLPLFPRLSHEASKAGTTRLNGSNELGLRPILTYIANTVVFVCVVGLLAWPGLPKVATHLLYAFGLCTFLTTLMDGPAALTARMLGIELAPTFDAPWLSTSLNEFWTKRWNVPTSSLLRCLVYDVIVDGQLVAPATRRKHSKVHRFIGVFATFFVSGVVHEAIVAAVTGVPPTGLLGAFFAVQAPLCIGEFMIKRWAAKRGLLPGRLLGMLLTVAVLEVCAYTTFFPPLEIYTDIAPRMRESIATHFMQVGSLLFS